MKKSASPKTYKRCRRRLYTLVPLLLDEFELVLCVVKRIVIFLIFKTDEINLHKQTSITPASVR